MAIKHDLAQGRAEAAAGPTQRPTGTPAVMAGDIGPTQGGCGIGPRDCPDDGSPSWFLEESKRYNDEQAAQVAVETVATGINIADGTLGGAEFAQEMLLKKMGKYQDQVNITRFSAALAPVAPVTDIVGSMSDSPEGTVGRFVHALGAVTAATGTTVAGAGAIAAAGGALAGGIGAAPGLSVAGFGTLVSIGGNVLMGVGGGDFCLRDRACARLSTVSGQQGTLGSGRRNRWTVGSGVHPRILNPRLLRIWPIRKNAETSYRPGTSRCAASSACGSARARRECASPGWTAWSGCGCPVDGRSGGLPSSLSGAKPSSPGTAKAFVCSGHGRSSADGSTGIARRRSRADSDDVGDESSLGCAADPPRASETRDCGRSIQRGEACGQLPRRASASMSR
jgi:hypothetical protein